MSTRAMVDPRLFSRGPNNWGYGDLGEEIGQGLFALGRGLGDMFANRRKMEAEGWMRPEEYEAWKKKQQAESENAYAQALTQTMTVDPKVIQADVTRPPQRLEVKDLPETVVRDAAKMYGPKTHGADGLTLPMKMSVPDLQTTVQAPTKFSYKASGPQQQADRAAMQQNLSGSLLSRNIMGQMLDAELPSTSMDIFSGRRVKAGPLQDQVQLYKSLIAAGHDPQWAHAAAQDPQTARMLMDSMRQDRLDERYYTGVEERINRTNQTESGKNWRLERSGEIKRGLQEDAQGFTSEQNAIGWRQRREMLDAQLQNQIQLQSMRNAAALNEIEARAGNDRVLQMAIAAAKLELAQSQNDRLARMRQVETVLRASESVLSNFGSEEDALAAQDQASRLFDDILREPQDDVMGIVEKHYNRLASASRRPGQPAAQTPPPAGGKMRPQGKGPPPNLP